MFSDFVDYGFSTYPDDTYIFVVELVKTVVRERRKNSEKVGGVGGVREVGGDYSQDFFPKILVSENKTLQVVASLTDSIPKSKFGENPVPELGLRFLGKINYTT